MEASHCREGFVMSIWDKNKFHKKYSLIDHHGRRISIDLLVSYRLELLTMIMDKLEKTMIEWENNLIW